MGFFQVRSISAARIGKGIKEKMQPHAGNHFENSGKAKPDSRGALGFRSLLFEPLGVVCKKIEVWKRWVVGKKGQQRENLKKLRLTVLHHFCIWIISGECLIKNRAQGCADQGFFPLIPLQEVLFDVKEAEVLVREKASSSKVSE